MVFGLPVDDAQKPTFYFDRVVEWERHDREGSPWDFSAAPLSETQKQPVKPVCAYEFFSPLGRQGADPSEVGDFNPSTVIVTMLEEEWVSVRGFSHMTVGPSPQRWLFRYWRPNYALNAYPVYQIHCAAEGVQ